MGRLICKLLGHRWKQENTMVARCLRCSRAKMLKPFFSDETLRILKANMQYIGKRNG